MTESEFDDFISHIDRSGGSSSCHVWQGPVKHGGYGVWKGQAAHRAAFAEKNGPIPEGAVIRHRCDNPPCCNPAHLTIGTHADNRRDCVSKGRHAKANSHPHTKLTRRQVARIRLYYKGWTHAEIAKKYNVSRSVITKILNGQSWKGVGVRANEPGRTSQTKGP